MKNSIFQIPIIPQTLSINNQRITSAKSINLDTITKLIEHSFKNEGMKATFALIVFEMFLFEGRSVLLPAQRGTEKINFAFRKKIKKMIWLIMFRVKFQNIFALKQNKWKSYFDVLLVSLNLMVYFFVLKNSPQIF